MKVFGIGLNKTGTTTLGQCGKILGYRGTSCSRKLLKEVVCKHDFHGVTKTIENFDFFDDWPWPLIYKRLDEHYPGSKFILTTRKDETRWLDSLTRHSMRTRPLKHCRKFAYGYHYPRFYQQEHIDFYVQHNQEARDYFSGNPDKFIELCWENGDGWESLCTFLGREIPDTPFPHANSSGSRKIQQSRVFLNTLLCNLLRF